MDIPTATPAEIDTELARINREIAIQTRIGDSLLAAERRITRHYETPTYQREDLARLRAEWVTVDQRVTELRIERAPLDAEYVNRGGWTRYFLVDANNGHVHYDNSSYRCSRQASTSHYWLTSESGRTAEDVVSDAGELACTVCFPWAPADTLSRPGRYRTPNQVEQEARRVEKTAKAAKRAEKAITNPDGTPLRINVDGYWETIATVVSAQRKIVDIAFDAKYVGRTTTDREVAACQVILEALAAKLSRDVETLKAEATVRLIQKCRREGVTY